MKPILISAVLILLGFHSLMAQMSSKKTAIQFKNGHDIHLGDIYSINNNNREEANYVITKSKTEVPIPYEASNASIEHSFTNQTDSIYAQSKGSDQRISHLQPFAIFTIVNTNNLPMEVISDDIYTLSPDLKKLLPEGFNPYNGMFETDINSKSLQHPITAR